VIYEQQGTFETRDQIIEYVPAKSDIVMEIDHDLIRMVLENIISNAGKYSEDQTHITVYTEEFADKVHINIQDEGVGIDDKDRLKVFEKFSRIDNSLSTKVGGTGLGLYWAKKIMDLHAGDITYVSTPGKGTIFTIMLPKKDVNVK
jgi:two-component system phosphate regulon sensor histidine kinase PhoR